MLSNAVIAERLDAFAVLLELSGAEPYTSRAYQPGRRDDPGDCRCRSPSWSARVEPGSCAGSGPGIERRLRELVETGEIHELSELEREVRPELIGLGRYLGVTPRRAVEIGRTLGVADVDELREAAARRPPHRSAGDRPEDERPSCSRRWSAESLRRGAG